jgi:hypothetical protein
MSVAQAQKRNPELVALLSADFQNRYEPNFAWKSICGLYAALPCLRGFWPMSAGGYDGQALDQCGLGHLLARIDAPHYGYENLIPYVEMDGTNDALTYADDANYDITGTETYTVAAQLGLTLGCWVKPDTFPGVGATDGIICKSAGAGHRSYQIRFNSTPVAAIEVSVDGTATKIVNSTETATASIWHLIIGRFIPQTSETIFYDNIETESVAGVPASIFNSDAPLMVGCTGSGVGANFFDGKMSMAFICACALSNSIITAIWQQTRAMYGR